MGRGSVVRGLLGLGEGGVPRPEDRAGRGRAAAAQHCWETVPDFETERMGALVVAVLPAVGVAPRNLVVSGASSGVGREIATLFAGAGWRVAAIARDGAGLDALARSAPPPGHVLGVPCDIRDGREVAAAVDGICTFFKGEPVGALVNNAAVYVNKPLVDMSDGEVAALIDTNLRGAVAVTRAFLPRMHREPAGSSRIVFINSVAGLPTWCIPGESVYAATKHGLSGFADALGNEVRGAGILVSSIHPGGVDTPLQERAGASAADRAQFLSPADVAAAVRWVVDAPAHVLVKRVELFGPSFWH